MKLTILTLAIIMTIACAMADVVSKEMTRFASDYTLKTSFFEDTSAYNYTEVTAKIILKHTQGEVSRQF